MLYCNKTEGVSMDIPKCCNIVFATSCVVSKKIEMFVILTMLLMYNIMCTLRKISIKMFIIQVGKVEQFQDYSRNLLFQK